MFEKLKEKLAFLKIIKTIGFIRAWRIYKLYLKIKELINYFKEKSDGSGNGNN
jgi:hypothetical protein